VIKPNKVDEQIIFYCKNWFEHIDIVEDIKKIMGYYYVSDPIYYDEQDVLDRVFKTASQCVPVEHFQERVVNLFRRNKTVSRLDMIQSICGLLCGLNTNMWGGEVIIEMTEPNYEILPKRVNIEVTPEEWNNGHWDDSGD